MKKTVLLIGLMLVGLLLLTGCDDAQIASRNLVKAADNFEVNRRVVFFNGITDKYLLEIEGKCSIEDRTGGSTRRRQLEVICKVGDKEFKKHFLGLADNVAYFVEHLESTTASEYHYRVTFKPQTIIPDIYARVDTSDTPAGQK